MDEKELEKIMFVLAGEKNYKLIKKAYKIGKDDVSREKLSNLQNIIYRKLLKENKNTDKQLLQEMVWYATWSDTEEEKRMLAQGTINYCTRCGWCCDTLAIHIVEDEVKRLIQFGVPVEYFKKIEDHYCFRDKPCLLRNGDCEVYPVRPGSCKSYPLTKSDGKVVIAKHPECAFAQKIIENRVRFYFEVISKMEQFKEKEKSQ